MAARPNAPGPLPDGHGAIGRAGLRRVAGRKARALGGGEVAELACLRIPEAEHDAAPRDAGLDQLVGDAFLGPVALDPDLPVDDLHVDQAAVDALLAHAPLRDHEVAPVLL